MTPETRRDEQLAAGKEAEGAAVCADATCLQSKRGAKICSDLEGGRRSDCSSWALEKGSLGTPVAKWPTANKTGG